MKQVLPRFVRPTTPLVDGFAPSTTVSSRPPKPRPAAQLPVALTGDELPPPVPSMTSIPESVWCSAPPLASTVSCAHTMPGRAASEVGMRLCACARRACCAVLARTVPFVLASSSLEPSPCVRFSIASPEDACGVTAPPPSPSGSVPLSIVAVGALWMRKPLKTLDDEDSKFGNGRLTATRARRAHFTGTCAVPQSYTTQAPRRDNAT